MYTILAGLFYFILIVLCYLVLAHLERKLTACLIQSQGRFLGPTKQSTKQSR